MTGLTNVPISLRLDFPAEYILVTTPQEKIVKIPTFVDEIGTYWFRFSSAVVGTYTFSTPTPDQKNEGSFELEKYTGTNPLYKHGRIISQKDARYLEHEDGTPFFWLADTWWFAMTNRAPWPEIFQKVVDKRKQQGFSVSQVVVGYPPEVSLASVHAQNTGGFPFLPSGEINSKYFQEVDTKIGYLIENGIVPCILGGWGHHMDQLGLDAMKKLWHEIIARYGVYPVVFCLAGEVDLIVPPGYGREDKTTKGLKTVTRFVPRFIKDFLKKCVVWFVTNIVTVNKAEQTKKYSIKERLLNWQFLAEYIKSELVFSVPLTAHVSQNTTASKLFNNPEWLDIDTIQSGHSYNHRSEIVQYALRAFHDHRKMINLEPWYEQIGGQFGAVDQRYAFWMAILAGATGASYGAHGLWNMATADDAFLAHWGENNWQAALEFPGAAQIGTAKEFLLASKWWLLESIPEIIIPHWQLKNGYWPLAAKIEDEVLIYFPAQTEKETFLIDTQLLPSTNCQLSWYDPQTLTIQKKESFNQEEISLKVALNSDVLVCISPAKV